MRCGANLGSDANQADVDSGAPGSYESGSVSLDTLQEE
jgi:hypothetical protein